MIPVGPTKPFFKMSPLQNRLKTCLVDRINFFTAACATFKAVEIAPLPLCLTRRFLGFHLLRAAMVLRFGLDWIRFYTLRRPRFDGGVDILVNKWGVTGVLDPPQCHPRYSFSFEIHPHRSKSVIPSKLWHRWYKQMTQHRFKAIMFEITPTFHKGACRC